MWKGTMYLVLLAAAAIAGMAQSDANAHIRVLNTTCTALTDNDCGFGYDVEVFNDGITLGFTSSTGYACLGYVVVASGTSASEPLLSVTTAGPLLSLTFTTTGCQYTYEVTKGGPVLGVPVNPSYKPVLNEPGHISYQTGASCDAVTSNDCGQEMDVTVDDSKTEMTFITSNKAGCHNYTAYTVADSTKANGVVLTDIHANGSVLIASFAGYGLCEYTYKVTSGGPILGVGGVSSGAAANAIFHGGLFVGLLGVALPVLL